VLRYISFLWNVSDREAHAAALHAIAQCRGSAHEWRTAFDIEGCVVLAAGSCAQEMPRILVGGGGVIVGHLFRTTHPESPLADLTREDSERIVDSGGRSLIADFWGNYVAFVRHRRWPSTLHVVRAPCSTLPCLHTRINGIDIYFSCIESCVQLFPGMFSIDWAQLARSLVGPGLSERTGLNEVREILPGWCDEWHGKVQRRHCYWNPLDVAKSQPIASFDAATAFLRNSISLTTHAWATRAPRILHALSGGLDSSIVLSCLYSAPSMPRITCLTHHAEGADGDERHFARLVADQFQLPHIEKLRTPDVDLRGALHGLRFDSNPGFRVREIDRIEPDIAREISACALTKGFGGDEIFCRHHNYFYAADLLRDHGLSFALLDQLAHSAILQGETLWKTLWRVMRGAFVPTRWNLAALFLEEQEGQSIIHPEMLQAIADDTDFDLPYATTTRRCGPGKLWQVSLATARRPYYTPWWRQGDPQLIAPLLSQPVIETCLRIPTYLQAANRGERAVARAAFSNALPPAVIQRRSKGGSEELAWKTLRANLPFVRELLLDGHLVRQRIVCRELLEAALADEQSSDLRSTVPVFDLIGAEAWLQPWQSPPVRTPSSGRESSPASARHPAG